MAFVLTLQHEFQFILAGDPHIKCKEIQEEREVSQTNKKGVQPT